MDYYYPCNESMEVVRYPMSQWNILSVNLIMHQTSWTSKDFYYFMVQASSFHRMKYRKLVKSLIELGY